MENFKCIICGKKIESLYFDSLEANSPEQGAWNGGVVEKLYMPYGSKFDSTIFIFGICDECIEKKFNDGLMGKKINEDFVIGDDSFEAKGF